MASYTLKVLTEFASAHTLAGYPGAGSDVEAVRPVLATALQPQGDLPLGDGAVVDGQ